MGCKQSKNGHILCHQRAGSQRNSETPFQRACSISCLSEWLGSKPRQHQMVVRIQSNGNPCFSAAGKQNGITTLENNLTVSSNKKVNTFLPYDAATALLAVYPNELNTYVHIKTCTWISQETLSQFLKYRHHQDVCQQVNV